MPVKSSLRDKLEDDVLDLSLSQITDVPVKEISTLTKGTTVDLSNNLISYLPENFPTLTHIIKLDLSKNQLSELPEYFGQLRNLKHLDLYSNQLERLPVSFAQLKNLKWLDLKNNPLVPALAQAAGPCITTSDCTLCAKKVVALLQSMQSQLERERQKRVIEEQKLEKKRLAKEESERERIRLEKRAAKERRREEARIRNNIESAKTAKSAKKTPIIMDNHHEKEKERSFRQSSDKNQGFCWSLFMFILGFALVCFGGAISMIWIYTGGNLDPANIDKALPVMRRDVDQSLLHVHKKVRHYYIETEKWMGPKVSETWNELKKRNEIVARSINKNLGPYFCSAKKTLTHYWQNFSSYVNDAWKSWILPNLLRGWKNIRPYFQRLGEIIIQQTLVVTEFVKTNGPVYWELFLTQTNQVFKSVRDYFN